MNTIKDFLNLEGLDYTVKRDSCLDRIECGLAGTDSRTRESYISFMPETDIRAGDILTAPDGKPVCVVKTQIEYFQRRPYGLNAYYKDDSYDQTSAQGQSAVYNIQNAYGSIIGNSHNATINYNSAISELKERVAADTSADKEQIEKIVSLLEMVVNNQVPPSQGLFSKFSEVMERHSWLSGSLAGAIFSWLTSQIL